MILHTKNKNTHIHLLRIFVAFLLLLQACAKTKEGCTFQDFSINTAFNHYAIQQFNDSVFYLGSGKLYDSGFVYKSTDKGRSWTLLASNLKGGVYGVQFRNEQTGIATAWNGSIYRTLTGSAPFQSYTKNFDNIVTSPLYINDSTLVAVSHIGYGSGHFWSSKDGGQTWDTVSFERNCSKIIQSKNNLFISAYGMVYRSDLQFKQWDATVVNGDLWVDIDFPSYNTGFIVGYDGSICKTVNRGETWVNMRGGNHLLYKSYTFTQADFFNEHIGVVGTYQGDILYTGNGGYSWEVISMPVHKTIRDIKMLNATSGIAVGDAGMIMHFQLPTI